MNPLRTPTSGGRKDWGWKVTIHVYSSGDVKMPSSDELIRAANEAAESLHADDFVGVDYKRVRKPPADQVAS